MQENSVLKNPKNEPVSKTIGVNEASTRHSLEVSFGHFILNQFLKKTKQGMNNIFTKFTAENNCTKCSDSIDLEPVSYKIDPEKILTLRTMYQKSKKSEESLSECIF